MTRRNNNQRTWFYDLTDDEKWRVWCEQNYEINAQYTRITELEAEIKRLIIGEIKT